MTSMKDSPEFKEVSILVRSMITPYNNDGGIKLSKVYAEYKEQEDEELPFRALGYSSIPALLSDIDNVYLERKYGEWYAFTTPNEKTAHIHELINNQKSNSRKKKTHSYGSSRFSNAGRMPSFKTPSTQTRFSASTSSYGNRPRSQSSNDYSSQRSRHSSSSSSSLLHRSSSSRTSQSSYDRQRSYNSPVNSTSSCPSYGRSYSQPSVQQKTPSPPSPPSPPSAAKIAFSQRKVHIYLPENKKSESTTTTVNDSSSSNDTVFRKPDVPTAKSQYSSNNEIKNRVSSSSPSSSSGNNNVKSSTVVKEKEPILPPLPPSPKRKSPLPPLPESPSPPSLLSLKINKPLPVQPPPLVSPKKSLPPLHERLKNFRIHNTSTTPTTSTTSITPTSTTSTTPTTPTTPKTSKTSTINNSNNNTSDPRKEVERLAEKLKLPKPVYQCASAKGPHENYSVLSLGPLYKFYSYPEGANSENEAQTIVAKKALIKLCEDMCKNEETLPTTKDETLIARRIVEIVNAHRSGVIEDSIPNYYKKNYNELLPNNWTKILMTLDDMIEIDNCVAGRLITKKTEISRTSPSPLALPIELPPWPVEITRVESTRVVWGRLNIPTYIDLLIALEKEMREYYSCALEPAKKVYPFHYYAIESNGEWHRVQIENIAEINGVQQACIFFIDIGDREWVNVKLLYPMLPQFYKIAAQAIKMSISRLEDFADCEKVTDIADQLLDGETLYIEVLDKEIDSSGVHNITSVFWDTKTDKDINMNEKIISYIEDFCLESPYIEKTNLQVLLTNVDDDGNIYLRSINDALEIYQIVLDKLIKIDLNDDLKLKVQLNDSNIDENDIFLVEHKNNNWIRVKVIQIMGFDLFKVFAIDKGYAFDVEKSQLLRLNKLSNFLNNFPQQVIRVTLNGINKLNLKMIKRLKELTPENETLSCVVVKSGKVPSVELIKRTNDNLLVSINLNLKEYQIEDDKKNDKIKTKKRSSIGNKIKLRPPFVPTCGKSFTAYVTNNCANPDNFIVQPCQNMNSLKEMMKKLSITCDSFDGPKLETVQPGQLCAAQHSDGLWYRAYVNHVIDNETIAVYFCDYGSMSITSIRKLQPLSSVYHELPYQALRAKLIGIKPKNGDWDMKTCFIFRDLVVDKNFEATIEDIETDIKNVDILGLKLVDRISLNRSRNINQVLVDREIAVSIK